MNTLSTRTITVHTYACGHIAIAFNDDTTYPACTDCMNEMVFMSLSSEHVPAKVNPKRAQRELAKAMSPDHSNGMRRQPKAYVRSAGRADRYNVTGE